MFNGQKRKIYQLLEERGSLGISCFEFTPLLGITQPNARILEMREKLGCTCMNSRGRVRFDCRAKQHITNDGNTTYLVKPDIYQPSFL